MDQMISALTPGKNLPDAMFTIFTRFLISHNCTFQIFFINTTLLFTYTYKQITTHGPKNTYFYIDKNTTNTILQNTQNKEPSQVKNLRG